MPTSKDLSTYPSWFMTIAERAQKAGYREELPLETTGACINLRQRFYAFRKVLAQAGHPWATEMLALSIQVQGRSIIFSKTAGLTPEAMKILGEEVAVKAVVPPLTSPDRIMESDASEMLLNTMLGIPPAGRSEQDATCPPHEPDTTGAFCLKCRQPL